LNKQEA